MSAARTFVVVWPITEAGYDMSSRELRAEAERELPEHLFEHGAVWAGEPVWAVRPFAGSPVGLALVVRGPAIEWDGRP